MNNKQRLEEPLNRIDVSLIKSEHRGYFDFLSNLDIPYSFDKESLEMNCIDDANGKTIKVHRIVALRILLFTHPTKSILYMPVILEGIFSIRKI